MIDVNGNRFMTHAEPIYVNGKRVNQVFVNGVLVYPCQAEQIRIIIPPSKTSYSSDETIDYTGIQVQAQNPDGTPWENPRYLGGMIPFEELIFPYQFINDVQIPIDTSSITGITFPEPFFKTGHVQYTVEIYRESYGELEETDTVDISGECLFCYEHICQGPNPDHYVVTLGVSKNPGTIHDVLTKKRGPAASPVLDPIVIEDHTTELTEYDPIPQLGYPGLYGTIHISDIRGYNDRTMKLLTPLSKYIDPNRTTLFSECRHFMHYMLYGDSTWGSGKMRIPVKWLRPEDGMELETYFEINVNN
jgi:hypothetical protein